MVTMAKPLANGYPIGAVLLRDHISSTMTAGECNHLILVRDAYIYWPGTHGTTFGGSPLACAVGHHVLRRLSSAESVAQVKATSAYLKGRLELLPGWFPSILESRIRGRGMILGLGFKDVKDPGRVVSMARERGVFVLTAGKDAVRIVPSLNVGQEEVDVAVDVLESCLGAMQ